MELYDIYPVRNGYRVVLELTDKGEVVESNTAWFSTLKGAKALRKRLLEEAKKEKVDFIIDFEIEKNKRKLDSLKKKVTKKKKE